MSFHNYLNACVGLFLEIEESLSQTDRDELTQLCSNLGLQGFCAWFDDHRQEVEKYVQATPSGRSRKKAWHTDKDQSLLLRLSALIYLQGSRAMLEQCCACEDTLQRDGSYRAIAHQAGSSYLEVKCARFDWWPLPDESPFVV